MFNGGSAVIDYRINIAEQGGSFSVVDSTTNTNYVLTGLTAGVNYEIKVEARNQYDYSDYSNVLTLLCAYIPTVPHTIQTAMVGDTVKITWQLASENGSPITQYKVFMQEVNESESTFTLESNDCDGTDATVIANLECFVNISTLLAEPYGFDGGDSIYAKVSAVNFYGESEQSLEGNDAYYTEVPDAPVSFAENSGVRTYTDMSFTWVDGALTGGAAVIDYRLKFRVSGSGNDYVSAATNIVPQSYTMSGLTLGTTYEFTVASRNSVGYSPESANLVILHAIGPE